ncbi:hypothetical protein AGABI2DRAFT_118337 [Agaricus bisporus var. bisporus H97]|uniref:hypothetical protein n=1 Tax=Agaricus bisporus var. bisporus (strain H97 / ATCC MYA-4626 / FGSC 10389) TaxID=936046 RepID=UPI00029F7725|nr:hypothetical protein AGABI2DRAFT_118337 [Agaricus bisporus var. bisporus H97]EKV47797.1 hypothetical protein AGABI2DRAFT_118337 [Agaricus bisporus var. bisporus H97]
MSDSDDSCTQPTPTDTLRRHEDYYLPGGDLHLLVGRTCFRIHSFFFLRESLYWKNRLAGMASTGMTHERPGFDENTALHIEGVEAEDFAHFLQVFYNPRYDTYNTSLANWETILRLATKWECPRIREIAVDHIDKLPGVRDVQKVKIYRDNQVSQSLIIPFYIALARRSDSLERAEFQYLDSEDLHYIVTAREMLRAPTPEGGTRLASPCLQNRTETGSLQLFMGRLRKKFKL